MRFEFEKVAREMIQNQQLQNGHSLPVRPWEDFPLYFTVEFVVKDYLEEIGFWITIMGLDFLSLSEEYAILKHAENSWTFSIKQENLPDQSLVTYNKIQIYTDDFDSTFDFIREKNYPFEIVNHSANQRYLSLSSPNQIPIELWSGWEE